MKVIYLLLLSFLSFCATGYSQSIFEFDYHFETDKEKEKYNALLVRNGDGTGFIRVRFFAEDLKQWVIVDMNMQEHYFGENNDANTDSSMLVFEGTNPKVISGPASIQYDPDVFIFKLNQSTGFYDPVGVLSGENESDDKEGIITNMQLLNEKDLTKQKVLQYFTASENVYENLFEEEATVRAPTPQQKSTRLILLLVANTNDISIGSTCLVDKDATYSTFSNVAEFLKIKFEPVLIHGKDFSKVNVEKAINTLAPGSNDILIFYYSGHGFNDNSTGYKYPFLDLRDKTFQSYGPPYTMNIEDIYKQIKSKGARLNLVISDCCNADPSQGSLVSSDGATTRNSSIGWNLNNCWGLFMNERPQSILMTAASKGELSAGNSTGGIFTFNFRESLETLVGPFYNNITWSRILATAQTQTVKKANHTLCRQPDNSTKVCLQNPVYKVE